FADLLEQFVAAGDQRADLFPDGRPGLWFGFVLSLGWRVEDADCFGVGCQESAQARQESGVVAPSLNEEAGTVGRRLLQSSGEQGLFGHRAPPRAFSFVSLTTSMT